MTSRFGDARACHFSRESPPGEHLRERVHELRRRVNVAIFPAQVDSILFREILVQ